MPSFWGAATTKLAYLVVLSNLSLILKIVKVFFASPSLLILYFSKIFSKIGRAVEHEDKGESSRFSRGENAHIEGQLADVSTRSFKPNMRICPQVPGGHRLVGISRAESERSNRCA